MRKPPSKRARALVLVARSAMQQEPVGLSEADVADVMRAYHARGYCPEPDEFLSDLVALWTREVWPRSIREVEA